MAFCACFTFLILFLNSGINRSADDKTSAIFGNGFPNRQRNLSVVITSEKHLHQSITATSVIASPTPQNTASRVTGFPFRKNRGVTPLWAKIGLVIAISRKSGM